MSSWKAEVHKGSGGHYDGSPVLWEVDILPTRHLQERFGERAGDPMPEAYPSGGFGAAGTLMEGRHAGLYYLIVPSVCRLVPKREEDEEHNADHHHIVTLSHFHPSPSKTDIGPGRLGRGAVDRLGE